MKRCGACGAEDATTECDVCRAWYYCHRGSCLRLARTHAFNCDNPASYNSNRGLAASLGDDDGGDTVREGVCEERKVSVKLCVTVRVRTQDRGGGGEYGSVSVCLCLRSGKAKGAYLRVGAVM